MCKATLDAFLLTILTVICLAFLGIPVTHPFLFVLVIVLVFALVYVIAVVLRLRRAATNSPAAQSEWQVPVTYLNSRPLG
jgi:flagellar biosynthesis/type III secretory pathway M-ring protein FliF/YscJ